MTTRRDVAVTVLVVGFVVGLAGPTVALSSAQENAVLRSGIDDSTAVTSSSVNESSSGTASTNTVEVVVHNFTADVTGRYTADGLVQGGSGSENTGALDDDRVWVRNDTQYDPWDPEFSPIVSVGGECTGALVDEYHVLTSAHCVYEDGWYSSLTVSPGAERVGGETTKPYGTANVVLARAYAPFVDSNDPANDTEAGVNDMALLTIDRPLGSRAGTLDFAYRGGTSVDPAVYDGHRVDVAGYPGTPPETSAPTPTLWRDHGNSSGDLCESDLGGSKCWQAALSHEVYTSDGQSGSPVLYNPPWVTGGDFLTDDAVILGVHSVGDINDGDRIHGWGPRITPNRSEHLESWISTDDNAVSDDFFSYRADERPALSFASVATATPDQWYDWGRTTPQLEVVNDTTLRYERDIVNVGSTSFSGTVTVTGYWFPSTETFRKDVQINSLAPGESVPVAVEREVPENAGSAGLELRLPNTGPFALTTVARERLVVRETGDAWYGRQYGQRLTGYNPHTPAPRGPGVATDWSVPLDSGAYTGVAVRNGTAYAVTRNATLYAIDSSTGTLEWQTEVGPTEGSVSEASVAVGQGNVYVGVDNYETNATVYAVDASTQTVEWQVDTYGHSVDGITPSMGRVVYVHADGVFTVDSIDGSVEGNTSSLQGSGAPAKVPRGSIVVPQNGNIASYSGFSSSSLSDPAWTVDLGSFAHGVTVGDEFLFARNGDSTLYGIDYDNNAARVVWEFTAGGHWAPDMEPVLIDGRVFVGDESGTLYARSAATGGSDWQTALPVESGIQTLVGANGTVYAASENGEVVAVDAADGTVLWQESVGGQYSLYAHAAAVDGRVIVPTIEGDASRVVALRTSRPGPAIEFTPADPQSGEPVTFDASNTTAPGGTITEYAWDFDGDGATDATGETATYTFGDDTTYPVTLSVTTDEGATNATTTSIAVGGNPPEARFDHGVPVVGEPTLFDGSNSTDPDGYITSYYWDYDGDGSAEDTGVTPGYTFQTPGERTVTLTVEDNESYTDTGQQVLNVTERPVPRFDHTEPVVNQSVTFDGAATTDDGSVTAYEWDLDGDGTYEGSGVEVTTTYATPGDRQVTLRVTDDRGVTNTTTRTVPVTEPPVALFGADAFFAVTGESVTFDASRAYDPDGEISGVEWDTDDDGRFEATGTRASRSFASPGVHRVRLRVTDDTGITRTTYQTITVVDPDDWAFSNYNPQNWNANSNTTAPGRPSEGDEIRPRWRTRLGGFGQSEVLVSNGTVYAGTYSNVYAVDASTGTVRWQASAGLESEGSLTTDGETLFVDGSSLVAVSTTDGQPLWSVGRDPGGTPIASGKTVYSTTQSGTVVAVNRTSGDVRWSNAVGDSFAVGPAVSNRTIYVASQNGGVSALWAHNGSVRWSHSIPDASVDFGAPLVVNGSVFVSARSNLTALDAETGTVECYANTGGGELSYSNGTLFAGSGLSVYDPNTCERTGYHQIDSNRETATVAGGLVFGGRYDDWTEKQLTYGYYTNGTKAWSVAVSSEAGAPVVANGTLYALSDQDAVLRALEVQNSRPVARPSVRPLKPITGESIVLDASASNDEAPGSIAAYEWDVDGDAEFELSGETASTSLSRGTHTIRLRVTDNEGATDTASVSLTAYGRHDWPAVGYDPGGTGYSPHTAGPVSNVSWAWNRTYENATRPAVVDGALYVGTNDGPNGSLVALGTDGRERWSRTIGPVEHVPGVSNGTVFAVTGAGVAGTGLSDDDSQLYALVPRTGSTLWNRSIDQPMGGPAVTGSLVYVGEDGGALDAYDGGSGDQRWWYSVYNDATVPALGTDTAFVGSGYRYGPVHAVDRRTGEKRWETSTYNNVFTQPTLSDERVFVATVGDASSDPPGELFALDRTTGASEWSAATDGRLVRSPALARGLVLVSVPGDANESATLRAFEAESGDPAWTYRTNGTALSAPTVVGNTVYVATTNASRNRLFGVNLSDGSERFAAGTNAPASGRPVVSNGTVYLAAGDRLRALTGDPAVPSASLVGSNVTVSSEGNATVGFDLTNDGSAREFVLNVTTPENVTVVDQTADGTWSPDRTAWTFEGVATNETVSPTVTLDADNASDSFAVEAVATAGGDVVATTTATVSACVSIPGAIDADDDGAIGDIEVLTAIEYWRNDWTVPDTCGETISDTEILELIEYWRDGTEV